MSKRASQKSAVLRLMAGILSGISVGYCFLMTYAVLVICLFTQPGAWFMVVFWASLSGIFWAGARWCFGPYRNKGGLLPDGNMLD